MYKLLLVDDEEEVRRGIIKKIPWEQYGFKIVGEAENGNEALEIAEKTLPDVVITDIKMPFMDGLELSSILKQRLPSPKIIILTGFDEFEFAQKAVRLNIVEYILKPISSDELIKVLIRVKEQIDKEFAQKENVQLLKEHYRKSLPVLREKFLVQLITSKLNKEEIYERSHNYRLKLKGAGYVVAAISIDYNSINSERLALEKESPHCSGLFDISEDKELLNFAVLNISEEIVSKHQLGMVFFHNEYIVILVVCNESDRNIVVNRVISVLDEIRQNIEKFLKFTVTIGMGCFCSDVSMLSNSYGKAVSALDYRLVLGNNRVIFIEDIEPKYGQKIVFDEQKERTLTTCIKIGTEKEIEETVSSLFKEIIEAKASFEEYQIYLMEILTSILKTAKDLNIDIAKIFGSNCNLFVEMYRFNNIQEVRDWILGICIKIANYISSKRQDSCKLLVQKAKEYALANYHQSDITINKVCNHLHISPSYFSALFKKETNDTFMNYLIKIRMDAAKELLRITDRKNYEIAYEVGYSEPKLF